MRLNEPPTIKKRHRISSHCPPYKFRKSKQKSSTTTERVIIFRALEHVQKTTSSFIPPSSFEEKKTSLFYSSSGRLYVRLFVKTLHATVQTPFSFLSFVWMCGLAARGCLALSLLTSRLCARADLLSPPLNFVSGREGLI